MASTPSRGSRAPLPHGTISVHERGFGFMVLDRPIPHEGAPIDRAFVAPPQLTTLLDGDRVCARISVDTRGRAKAETIELVDRPRSELLGTCVPRGAAHELRLDRRLGNADWELVGAPASLRSGTPVLAKVSGPRAARFVRALDDPRERALLGVLIGWRLRGAHSAEHERAARDARPAEVPRRDLTKLPTITIDAPSTKDLDDALTALPAQSDGAVRVLVSIADVTAYVAPGSALDKEARRRATSVYLPDRTLPMLPTALSHGALSLLPGVERLALTVELRIDPDGAVTAVDVYNSKIVSDARLSYAQVHSFLDEGLDEVVPAPVRGMLRWLRTAASRLGRRRMGRGGVTFEREDVRLTVDRDTGNPTDLRAHPATTAHRLVERLMVAANEAIGRWLTDRGIPALYRVQPEPERGRVDDLIRFAQVLGFETGFGARITPLGLGAFEAQFASATAAAAMRSVLLRVLGRARYQAEPAPHFGLAAPLYVHFTSPIRRYADLMVHRVIKAFLRGEREFDAAALDLDAIAREINDLSYRARKAEDERRRCLTAQLFAERIGQTFAGHVVAIKHFGAIVQLLGLGVTGTIATGDLPGGASAWEHDLQRETLSGNGQEINVGSPLRVTVRGTDPGRGRITLVLEDRSRDDDTPIR